MAQKIEGAQRDFSFGEIDAALKRADDHPARKAGLRQMVNARILNSGAIQDRPGRSALFLEQGRVEKVLMSPGNLFYLAFGAGYLRVYNVAGVQVFSSTKKADGATNIPWTLATVKNISWVVAAAANQFVIYICYGDDAPVNVPQILTWDGVSQTSTWTLSAFAEAINVGQKRTPFYRISPPNVTMQPGGLSGSVSVAFSANILVAGMIGTRFEYCGAQLTLTAVSSPTTGTATANQPIPQGQALTLSSTQGVITVGQELIGSTSHAIGIVTSFVGAVATVQLLPDATGTVRFFTTENAVGPTGLGVVSGTGGVNPQAVATWSDEVMNLFRGYPKSVFYDQGRLGFCNFPALPSGIGWSTIGLPTDFYAEDVSSPANAVFELAPHKSQVLFVVAGPESSEFVLCDNSVYYIPISPTNPLKPGSVSFQLLSGDGAAPVQPRVAQELILYVNAGQNSVMAIISTGAYYRPFNTKNLSDLHAHLFNGIQCIAVPSADGAFNERYAYVLNGDGTIAVGKYDPKSLQSNQPVIGWGPWSGSASVSWIGAQANDVIFTSSYFGVGIVEILDDTQYLDCALNVNALPAALAAPIGKGPLWFIPSQTVTLIDQVTRMMGTYQIDANGFIVPQFNGGENLAIASLVAGQPWTMIAEPFCPTANPGADVGQRMSKRRISRLAAYVERSTGFLMARLFSGPITPTSPALGAVIGSHRVPAWNIGDDATKPPPQRETVERWRPLGRDFDPRVAIIKDTPGPLLIAELGVEATI